MIASVLRNAIATTVSSTTNAADLRRSSSAALMGIPSTAQFLEKNRTAGTVSKAAMAERASTSKRRKNSSDSGGPASTTTMGKSLKEKKVKKPKERWLLTRKTWRYMTDAGRKLIPDGTHNRPEDIPKIEAYFQEVCQKEPRFLLWRKSSYPGALGFRSHRKRRDRRKGGSCRKASSADEAEDIVKPARPKDLALTSISGGRFDINKLKYDFLNKSASPSSPRSFLKNKETFPGALGASSAGASGFPSVSSAPSFPGIAETRDQEEEKVLVDMLEQYLSISEPPHPNQPSTSSGMTGTSQNLDYQALVDKLQRHLMLVSQQCPQYPELPQRRDNVQFEGDHVQKSLSETLNRYFSRSPNRDRVISDMLTDRKLLQKLYFDLRRTKGFGANRGGAAYSGKLGNNQWRTSLLHHRSGGSAFADADEGDEYSELGAWRRLGRPLLRHRDGTLLSPPPLIEIQGESQEQTFQDWGVQTDVVPENVLAQCDEEYKKIQAEKDEEMKENRPGYRRRSSVDNDDVSQSVSDTIKRYLRMARKKSVDSDKVDRFKRVNYDRNLRNIKAKGEITKPGDDDGLNKGCQTNDDWIVTFKELKFDPEFSSDHDISQGSRLTSSRSSFDAAGFEELNPLNAKSSPTSPTGFLSSSQSFISHLLHGNKHHHDKSASGAAVAAVAMQKSKSSSSVMHHGSRLVAKKIFRSRSKSQTRASAVPSVWTPQGGCAWSSVTGRQVVLGETSLLQLSDVERKILQKVALAKLQALNLGITVRPPTELGTSAAQQKPKRRAYLLKRKALTTGFFDTGRKDVEKDKDGNVLSGLVFGIPLSQCVENDRLSRTASGTSSFRSGDLSGNSEEHSLGRHGSRASFSSLIDAPRGEESGSCESLMSRDRIIGSVPGLLNTLSCGSTADIVSATAEDEPAVPNIIHSCVRHLETHGLHTLGIFRVSTSKKRVRQLREDFDSGKETSLDDETCPHDVATLLKEYLRDLPDPLLCRDLYQAFVQTQRIRNRRLQFEAIQHLIQLLPPSNRDTLCTLLNFLANVARNSNDQEDGSGETVPGNKMDSNNLATVFAPNILHSIKPGSAAKDTTEKAEDRIDVINVVRTLIDHNTQLFYISAELLDEIYVHMMDSYPEALDQLLNKREALNCAEESVEEVDSESSSVPWSPTCHDIVGMEQLLLGAGGDGRSTPPDQPKRTWSREEFLHETAAMGGPNVAMRIRSKDKDRPRERSTKKRWKDDLSVKKRTDDTSGNSNVPTTAKTIFTRIRSGSHKDDDQQQYITMRSSSIDSSSSVQTDVHDANSRSLRLSDDHQTFLDRRQSSPYLLGGSSSGIITASLTIPVQTSAGNQPLSLNVDDSDIPYIEDGSYAYAADGGRQQMTIGMVKTPSAPPRRRQRSMSGSDSSQSSNIQPVTGSISLMHQQGYDSAVGSSATFSSPPHYNTPSSVGSSIADAGMYSSPPSWASTPPTSPDSTHTSVNYIPDDIRPPAKITLAGKQVTTATLVAQKVASGILTKESIAPSLQKVSFTSTSELQQVRAPARGQTPSEPLASSGELPKSASTPAVVARTEHVIPRLEPKLSTGISNIGGAVLRSKTADFERMMKSTSSKVSSSSSSSAVRHSSSTATVTASSTSSTVISASAASDKKKYTKRRYTDSRHQTRHIPDSETLDSSSSSMSVSAVARMDRAAPDGGGRSGGTVGNVQGVGTQPGPVYKRRELIASVPKDRKSLV